MTKTVTRRAAFLAGNRAQVITLFAFSKLFLVRRMLRP
jgi:hypothetical protein